MTADDGIVMTTVGCHEAPVLPTVAVAVNAVRLPALVAVPADSWTLAGTEMASVPDALSTNVVLVSAAWAAGAPISAATADPATMSAASCFRIGGSLSSGEPRGIGLRYGQD